MKYLPRLLSLFINNLRPRRRLLNQSCLLLKQLECALLRLEARLPQTRQGLLARRMLSTGNDAPLLGLHQILASQAAAGVLGRPMEHLRLGAHRRHLGATHHLLATIHLLATHLVGIILTRGVVVSGRVRVRSHVRVHLYCMMRF